jgi:MFS family permease
VLNWLVNYAEDKSVKTNFIINVLDGSFYAFAISFISFTTVLPLFVKKIGGNNIAVGLIPVIWTVGFNIPQILMANYVRRKPYKKNLLLVTAFFQRLPWLMLGFFCWFVFDTAGSDIQLLIFFVCYALAAVAGALNLPGWFDLVAKVTPINVRGRLFGVRAILGALLGIIGGWITEKVLAAYQYPYSFSILFFISFGVILISYAALFFIKEKEPNAIVDKLHYAEFLKRIPSLVRYNTNYRNFLIADALLISALMADAFYALNAVNKFSLDDSYAGIFTIIMMSSIIAGNMLFGYAADRLGHKINLWLASVSALIACLLALASASLHVYYAVFAFSAFTATLIQVSRLTIIAELCSEQDRPTYVAVTNMITAPFILFGVVAGWIANNYGYNMVFILAGSFAFISSLIFGFKVKEPRRTILVNS